MSQWIIFFWIDIQIHDEEIAELALIVSVFFEQYQHQILDNFVPLYSYRHSCSTFRLLYTILKNIYNMTSELEISFDINYIFI